MSPSSHRTLKQRCSGSSRRGSIGGHIAPSRALLDTVRGHVADRGADLLLDSYIAYTGDDIALLMVHARGVRDRRFCSRLRREMPDAGPRWTQHVTRTSNALDLEPGVFTWPDPRDIARSLQRSAERSERRRADPFRSAMSMLSFYINRAGARLDAGQRERLEAAKDELRALYGRPRRRAQT
jgi:hypothetical protein